MERAGFPGISTRNGTMYADLKLSGVAVSAAFHAACDLMADVALSCLQ